MRATDHAEFALLPAVPARGLDPHPSEHRIVPVRVREGVAEPVGHGGPAMLRGAAPADRPAVVDPGGEGSTVHLLPELGGGPWVA
ncbi:hypothetical protein [Pseudonocardia humida]|uniref:MoeA C-terminal domain-containing protein n=1 Tax=Pseudonocardia humida TaxID=2800819 RepID=A0ABT0ZX60_9PSEU|nr:hypothetical protein [Pseudonocardia humida]MCO1655278.1 hypothetical protein [Pseudonocardia humida]